MARLQSGVNTLAMAERVRAAFDAWDDVDGAHDPDVFFEHEQWWVQCWGCGATWSVVDAAGPGSVDGFGFEQIDEGDETCSDDDDEE